MESVLVILIAIAALLFIIVSAIYNSLDRMRFFMDRMLKRLKPQIDEWAEECEREDPGCADAYFAAKKNWEKTACLRDLAAAASGGSEKKLSMQDELMEMFTSYNSMAERYNAKLENPFFSKVASLLRFQPYAVVDFYPDVTMPEKE